MMAESIKDLRVAAVRKAREESSSCIAECIFFGAGAEASSEVIPMADEVLGRERIRRWIIDLTGESATDGSIAKVIAEGGFYCSGFKLKLEPTERYALLYDIRTEEAGA
jgi:hypothetical protein